MVPLKTILPVKYYAKKLRQIPNSQQKNTVYRTSKFH